MRVLVTGGAGMLGRRVVPRLLADGHRVRVMTHSGRTVGGAESVPGDLEDMRGVPEALEGVECVVHCASSPRVRAHQVEVEGTRRLAEIARQGGADHLVYVSIAGVDRCPHYPYYRAKLQAEEEVAAAGLPWTILRATQFHEFVDMLLMRSARYPLMLVPRGWRLQPVAAGEVAERLARAVSEGPRQRLPELGGPEVLTSEALATTWRRARRVSRPLLLLPWPGRFSAALRGGALTCPGERRGRTTFESYLAGSA